MTTTTTITTQTTTSAPRRSWKSPKYHSLKPSSQPSYEVKEKYHIIILDTYKYSTPITIAFYIP